MTESMPGDAPAPRPTLRTVAACAVYSLSLLSTWLLNSTAYPGFNDFFPMARDVATVFGALFAFVLAFAAMRRPRVLVSRGFLVLCVAAMLAGVGAMFVGARLQSPLLSSLGACLRSAAPFVNAAYVALMLSGLSRRSCFVFLAVSYLLKYGWMGALWHTPLGVKWAIFAVLPALCTVALYLFARRQLGRVDCPEPPGDLAITNPLSFLPFTHGLFVVILMFSAAQGFVITYGSQNSLPMPFIFAGIPVAVVMVLVACGRLGRLDGLYTVAFGLVLAGLLLVPASLSGLLEAGLAVNTLLNAGNDVFNLVVVFMAAQIAARNLYAALPMIMAVRVASGLGTELGASTGHLANYATGGNPMFMLVAIAACTLAFTLYNFYVMRKFSFDRTILGIEPVRWVASDASAQGAPAPSPPDLGSRQVWRAAVRPAERLRREVPTPGPPHRSTGRATRWPPSAASPRASRRCWRFWRAAATWPTSSRGSSCRATRSSRTWRASTASSACIRTRRSSTWWRKRPVATGPRGGQRSSRPPAASVARKRV